MFVQIGRVGRSLGVHLLLASQRLEEGRLRGLDTHLSYRIGLRTFSAMESRVVLGDAGRVRAAALARPRIPALRHGADAAVQGRVRVGRLPAAERRDRSVPTTRQPDRGVHDGLRRAAGRRGRADGRGRRRTTGRDGETLLDILVAPPRRAGPGGAPGVAAAAERADPARRAAATAGAAAATGASPSRRPSCTARCACRSASWTGRTSSAATGCGWTCPAPAATSWSSAARRAARAPCSARW